jgi:hypothetical protein
MTLRSTFGRSTCGGIFYIKEPGSYVVPTTLHSLVEYDEKLSCGKIHKLCHSNYCTIDKKPTISAPLPSRWTATASLINRSGASNTDISGSQDLALLTIDIKTVVQNDFVAMAESEEDHQSLVDHFTAQEQGKVRIVMLSKRGT